MPSYAIAHLRTPTTNDDILEYVERIQATLDPYEGRFLVHVPRVEVIEGTWPGSLVIIEFPDGARAREWYASPAYQEILPLRTRHLEADAILVDGVPPDYHPRWLAARMRERAADQPSATAG